MLMTALIAGGSILYISSKTAENLIDVFFIIPGLILLGAFWGLLNGGLDDNWEIIKWAVGVPLVFFMLKPKG
jgi:hypothetical protein